MDLRSSRAFARTPGVVLECGDVAAQARLTGCKVDDDVVQVDALVLDEREPGVESNRRELIRRAIDP